MVIQFLCWRDRKSEVQGVFRRLHYIRNGNVVKEEVQLSIQTPYLHLCPFSLDLAQVETSARDFVEEMRTDSTDIL